MKTYNRALDFTALALNAGRKGNHTLAAKLFAKALDQKDVVAAVQTLEASNAHAFAVTAAATKRKVAASKSGGKTTSRLRASEDEMFDDLTAGEEGDLDMDDAADMSDLEAAEDEGMDDMDDMGEDDPAETMASVLKSMTRRAGR